MFSQPYFYIFIGSNQAGKGWVGATYHEFEVRQLDRVATTRQKLKSKQTLAVTQYCWTIDHDEAKDLELRKTAPVKVA